MARKTRVLSIMVCGGGPAAAVGTLVKLAIDRGWTVQVIATPSALEFFDASQIEAQTGAPVRSKYSKPGAPRSRIPDAIIVAPATYNTINQWALGLSDTYALGVLAEQTGLGVPIVVLPFVSAALASRPPFQRSVKALRAEGVSILLGRGGVPSHPAHGESDALDAFPWQLALDEAAEMTGFGALQAKNSYPERSALTLRMPHCSLAPRTLRRPLRTRRFSAKRLRRGDRCRNRGPANGDRGHFNGDRGHISISCSSLLTYGRAISPKTDSEMVTKCATWPTFS